MDSTRFDAVYVLFNFLNDTLTRQKLILNYPKNKLIEITVIHGSELRTSEREKELIIEEKNKRNNFSSSNKINNFKTEILIFPEKKMPQSRCISFSDGPGNWGFV